MRVRKTEDGQIGGVPNYYEVYLKWLRHYKKTGDSNSKILAQHYARVAEEMGQVNIDEDITLDDF